MVTVIFISSKTYFNFIESDVPKCFEDGIVYRGHPVKQGSYIPNVMSAEDCQHECELVDDCKFWTWSSPKLKRNPNTCRLIKGQMVGKISGPKICK